MNNPQAQLLNLCLADELFAALYEALCHLHHLWHTSSPVDLWITALTIRHDLSKSPRPELLLPSLLCHLATHDMPIIQALLLMMLLNEDQSTEPSPLKTTLANMLLAQGTKYHTISQAFWQSEDHNEKNGYQIQQTDYTTHPLPSTNTPSPQALQVVQDIITTALQTYDTQICQAHYLVLSRINQQQAHIYDDALNQLATATDQLQHTLHQPPKVENTYHNTYEQVTLQQGSTLNGNITTTNPQ